MSSLRARLAAAFALVALIPIAVAVALLAGPVTRALRGQATDRLGATLDVLRSQLRADAERNAERLRVLARDPELRRRVLVPGAGAELLELLARERFLLGLDVLFVTDASGRVTADAAQATSALRREERSLLAPARIDADAVTSAGVSTSRGDGALLVLAHAPILYLGDRVGLLCGGVALDSARLAGPARAGGVELVLRGGEGRPLAATLAAAAQAPPPAGSGRLRAGGRSYFWREAPLALGPRSRETLLALASTGEADRLLGALGLTALAVLALGLAIAATLGAVGSWQVSRPVERLARFSERIARGAWDEPLRLDSVRELDTLVASLERMRQDLTEYRRRLRASERHAAWSLMARQVAHEVRNPLTPIAVSVADLKRSYEQARGDFPAVLDQAVATIGEEVRALKALLHEFSELGRFAEPRPEPFAANALPAEIAVLYASDVASGRLAVTPAAADVTLHADRGQLRQALINLVQNGLEAAGRDGRVTLSSAVDAGVFELRVADTGPGLTPEQLGRLFVPHFTTKPHGSGLGLVIAERIASDHGGSIAVDSAPGQGTTFRIRIPLAGAPAARPESGEPT